MPIVKSEFAVDLFQMKHSRDATVLLSALKTEAAQAFGIELVKKFPYEKIEAYEGEFPEMSANKEHQYVDKWRSEFVVMSLKDYNILVERARILES